MNRILAMALIVLCVFGFCSCAHNASESETNASSEIEITKENFDKFFKIEISELNNIERIQPYADLNDKSYPARAVYRFADFTVKISPRAPGSFKNVGLALNITSDNSGWSLYDSGSDTIVDMSDPENLEMSIYYNVELPVDGNRSDLLKLGYYTDDFVYPAYKPNQDMIPEFEMIDISGSYVPAANEDISSYK